MPCIIRDIEINTFQQLERRDPNAEEEDSIDEDEDPEDDQGIESDSTEESVDSDSGLEEQEDDINEEPDIELRRRIEVALRVNGVDHATGDSEEESEEEVMDDEQMMAIDDELAEIFRSRVQNKKKGKHRLLNTGPWSLIILDRYRCAARSNSFQKSRARSSGCLHQGTAD
jgi:hypothetical protein